MGKVHGSWVGSALSRYVWFEYVYVPFSMPLSNTGLQDGADATIATLRAIEHQISKQAEILVDMCSFAGTGNVLKVQDLLHHCDEHIDKSPKEKEKDKDAAQGPEEPPKDDTFQAFAVLGIALVAMGEEVGAEMSMRQFNHLVSILGADTSGSS